MPSVQFIVVHGPLMVVGFLGTLIGLERAVALGRLWPYGIPMLSGVSALSALVGLPGQLSAPPADCCELALDRGFLCTLPSVSQRAFCHHGLERGRLVGGQYYLV